MKQFMCYWNPKLYSLESACRIEDELFFSEENGYSEDDNTKIVDLSIGESITFDDNDHIITRVK